MITEAQLVTTTFDSQRIDDLLMGASHSLASERHGSPVG